MANDHNLDSGLDSRASQCWLNLHLTDVFEQEKDSQRFKLHPGLMKFWPEVWSNVSKQSQSEEGRQWDTDKPKLDAARRLRGIYYIDSDNKEFDNILKNATRKWKTRMGKDRIQHSLCSQN